MSQPSNGSRLDEIKVPIPPKLDIASPNYNPAFNIPQYEYRTVASFEAERESKITREFLTKHKEADVLVCNQSGTPLYALYKTPFATHNESTEYLFKMIRANKLNEWEEEL